MDGYCARHHLLFARTGQPWCSAGLGKNWRLLQRLLQRLAVYALIVLLKLSVNSKAVTRARAAILLALLDFHGLSLVVLLREPRLESWPF